MDANRLAADVATAMRAAEGLGTAWNIGIDEVRAGYARLSMAIRPDMTNGHGLAHGGVIFAFADSAFSYVCNGGNNASVAAQASIVFLGKAGIGDTLIAVAEEVVREGRAGVTRVSVTTSEGRPVAEFTGYSRTVGGRVLER